MRVFHGTTNVFWKRIKREGLKPPALTGINNWGGDNKVVFLCDTLRNAAGWGQDAKEGWGHTFVAVVELDIPEMYLTTLDPAFASGAWIYEGSIPKAYITSHHILTQSQVSALLGEGRPQED